MPENQLWLRTKVHRYLSISIAVSLVPTERIPTDLSVNFTLKLEHKLTPKRNTRNRVILMRIHPSSLLEIITREPLQRDAYV